MLNFPREMWESKVMALKITETKGEAGVKPGQVVILNEFYSKECVWILFSNHQW